MNTGPMNEREMTAWDVYFASLVSISLHPGNRKLGDEITIAYCASRADEMLIERREREKCLHG